MKHESLRWVDFAIGDVRARNHVVDIREAVRLSRTEARENSYITVYRFGDGYPEHLADTGSVRGYAGDAFADFLPIDIDREGNLHAALIAGRALAFLLHDRYDADPSQIRYFFSGAKGFHLLIPTALLGDVAPSVHLPAGFRGTALALAEEAGEEIDRVIYDPNRLFRLPDTKHPSGLWKVEMTWQEFNTWTTDEVRFAARTPRGVRWQPRDLETNDRLAELFAKQMDLAERGVLRGRRTIAPGGEAEAIANILAPAFVKGNRHNLILAFAGYAAKRHLPRETALGVADALLAGALDVVDPDNLPNAINATYDRVRRGEQVKGYRELEVYFASVENGTVALAGLRKALGDGERPAERTQEAAPTAAHEEDDDRIEPPEFDVMLGDVLDRFAEEKRAPIDATPTPWGGWNLACRGAGGGTGIARGWHVVVGARSGNGKSLLGANMAATAISHGERVAIISLEMTQIEMQTRVMAIVGNQPINDLEHGNNFRPLSWDLAKREMHRIHDKTGGRLYINRKPMSRLVDVGIAIRHLYESAGVKYFVVDYLQLAAIGTGRASDLLDKVTEVSFMVRGLAKELKVTTVGMSQLNRESSKLKETPRKEGLMGGSPLENDAEQVLLLDHSRIERIASSGEIFSWAVLDKNRHGPSGEFPTALSTKTLHMRERMPDEITLSEAA